MTDAAHSTPLAKSRAASSLGLAYAAFVGLGVIWGANFIFVKWAIVSISPAQIVLLRVLFGFLPLLAFALATRALRWRDLRHASAIPSLSTSRKQGSDGLVPSDHLGETLDQRQQSRFRHGRHQFVEHASLPDIAGHKRLPRQPRGDRNVCSRQSKAAPRRQDAAGDREA